MKYGMDECGDPNLFYLKGDHKPSFFCDAVREFVEEKGWDWIGRPDEKDVKKGHIRRVPRGDIYAWDFEIIFSKPGKGAMEITYVEL